VMVRLRAAATLPQSDIIKIDAEGSELPILRELKEAGLLQRPSAILLEYHSEEDAEKITALLTEVGFRVHDRRPRCPNRGELKFVR
jgi:hypothetical protein